MCNDEKDNGVQLRLAQNFIRINKKRTPCCVKVLGATKTYTQRKVSFVFSSIRYIEEECINRFEKT